VNNISEKENNLKHLLPEILNQQLCCKGCCFMVENTIAKTECIFPQKASSKTKYGRKLEETLVFWFLTLEPYFSFMLHEKNPI
jgi:hypothetical protein